MADLAARLRDGERDALIDFWAATEGECPLVEPIPDDPAHRWVTFLWRGADDTRGVELHGGIPTRAPKPLTRLPNTDLWFLTERLPTAARFSYRLVVKQPQTRPADGDGCATIVPTVAYRPDPRNARAICGESVLELPDAPPQPWIRRDPDVPAGEVRDEKLTSAILKEERAVTVYTPPGYDPIGEPCDLLVLCASHAQEDPSATTKSHLNATSRRE